MTATRGELDGWVLTDQQGNYYLLSREMLAQARVPADQRAMIEQQLKPNDVRGFQGTFEGRPSPFVGLTLLGELPSRLIPEASHTPGDGSTSNIQDGTSNTRR